MWRCAASLERLAPDLKETLGDALVKDLARPNPPNHVLWCLGRLGGRVPLYGPANTTVPKETAERWAAALLDRPFAPGRETADAIFALAQLARVSGDRARDLDDALRAGSWPASATSAPTRRPCGPSASIHELETEQQGQALGDALPVGLRLLENVQGV